MIDSIFYFFAFIGVIIFIAYYAYSLISAINNDINRKKRLEEFLKIDEAPMAEAKPVVHAHWEEHREFYEDEGFEGYYYSCSNCGGTLYGDVEGFNFCHCCGAQMDEKIDE